jgi:hypothetical protein
MDPWMALGIFLLGTGAGALTTVALYVKQIRRLKNQLEAAHKPRQKNDVTNRTSASPPSEGAPNDRHLYPREPSAPLSSSPKIRWLRGRLPRLCRNWRYPSRFASKSRMRWTV